MKRTLTSVRCVPRFGYHFTDVRTIDLGLDEDASDQELLDLLREWFQRRGIEDAVFDVGYDDNGVFAIVNDEAYEHAWGEPLI
ncbi:MAG: hypothetical protein U1D55_15845 [Phycisphaerae bacterium]